jgi:hypothetical protein
VGFVWKSCLFCDLEDFDFLHLEIGRTGENRLPVQSSVVGVGDAKGSATVGVCVAVLENAKGPSSQCRSLVLSEKVGDEEVNKFLWGDGKPCCENDALRSVAQTAGSHHFAVLRARLSRQTLSER